MPYCLQWNEKYCGISSQLMNLRSIAVVVNLFLVIPYLQPRAAHDCYIIPFIGCSLSHDISIFTHGSSYRSLRGSVSRGDAEFFKRKLKPSSVISSSFISRSRATSAARYRAKGSSLLLSFRFCFSSRRAFPRKICFHRPIYHLSRVAPIDSSFSP